MRLHSSVLVPVLVLAATGCVGPRVDVLPSGLGVAARPRAPDCKVDFFRTKIDRPYDEIAAMHAFGGDSFKAGPADFQEVLRAKACALGADAVIVTREYSGLGGEMNAVAVRYRDAGAPPSAPGGAAPGR